MLLNADGLHGESEDIIVGCEHKQAGVGYDKVCYPVLRLVMNLLRLSQLVRFKSRLSLNPFSENRFTYD